MYTQAGVSNFESAKVKCSYQWRTTGGSETTGIDEVIRGRLIKSSQLNVGPTELYGMKVQVVDYLYCATRFLAKPNIST